MTNGNRIDLLPDTAPKDSGTGECYCVFETDWGWCAVAGTRKSLTNSLLPMPSESEARELIAATLHPDAVEIRDMFEDVVQRFVDYFLGKPVDFDVSIEFRSGTEFMRRVWLITRGIPIGETRSYGWIADRMGKPGAARAVGRAMSANPLPLVVPCHRVVGSNGELRGFSAQGGVDLKRRLLQHERQISLSLLLPKKEGRLRDTV